MRSIFVRVEPPVRLVADAKTVELLIVLHLEFEASLAPVAQSITKAGALIEAIAFTQFAAFRKGR
jgi:hypothetical protein